VSTPLETSVGRVAGWLVELYALDLGIRAEDHVLSISHEDAQRVLPAGCRSGVVVLEEAGELQLGLHLAPEDRSDEGTLVEETSHLVCLAWHGGRDLPVSQLILELQADVDRFVFARLAALRSDRDALVHFERFHFAAGLSRDVRARYSLANARAHAYCRGLCERFPHSRDTPALVAELRRFYRASPETKLRAA
jgi:hypothetical protein